MVASVSSVGTKEVLTSVVVEAPETKVFFYINGRIDRAKNVTPN